MFSSVWSYFKSSWGPDIEILDGLHRDVHLIICFSFFQAAYDKVRAAKKQAEERTRKLDDKRKKIKLGQLLFIKHTHFCSVIMGIHWLCGGMYLPRKN